ncbi:MAG: hypothetical protein Q4B22_08635, partial [Eubacteriales bacterium]|nr:hypothetical protein [Eubacteriales bacterium]
FEFSRMCFTVQLSMFCAVFVMSHATASITYHSVSVLSTVFLFFFAIKNIPPFAHAVCDLS